MFFYNCSVANFAYFVQFFFIQILREIDFGSFFAKSLLATVCEIC